MISLRGLPITLRMLFSSFLIIIGIGYLTALSYLFLVDVEPHQKMGRGMVEGISAKYHGSATSTRLEAALIGNMADRIPAEERDQVLSWIRAGAKADSYASVEPIIAKNCASCHQPGMPISPLASFDDVQKLAKSDPGASMLQLARVSHVHLFGISVIFLLTGVIFSLSESPTWFRTSILILPYLAILMDIGSWWATKYFDPLFAYIVLIGGGLMGLALGLQILVSLWDMWIGSRRTVVAANDLLR